MGHRSDPRRADATGGLNWEVAWAERGTQIGMDAYNVTNTGVVTSFNQTFSPTTTTWLTPTGIQPARYVKFNGQIDF
jgi:hypothetical protein